MSKMKFKNRIMKDWSLECNDEYQSIKEQLNFNDRNTFKKRIIFKTVMVCMASIMFVFFTFNAVLNDEYKGNDAESSMPGDSGEANKPSEDQEFEGGLGDKFEDVEPIQPSNPGEPGSNAYLLFIEGLKANNFEASFIETMTYSSNLPTINGSSSIDEKVFVLQIANFLNGLSYEETIIDEDIKLFNCELVINNDWCKIYFDENEYIALKYENEYHLYKTDCENIYENLKEFIK